MTNRTDAEVERMMVSAASRDTPMVLGWESVELVDLARLIADRERYLLTVEDELFQHGIIVNAEGLLSSRDEISPSDVGLIGLMDTWQAVKELVGRLKAAQAERAKPN